jgi:branched-chain amino acid transport system ATP-binding protein
VTALLEVTEIEVAYGNVKAVQGVSLSVEEGSMLALLGPNGAGKSSLIGAVCGLVRTRAGSIRIGGEDVTGRPADRLARSGIRLVPEARALFPRMTVIENLLVGAGRLARSAFDRRLEKMFDVFPVLADRRRQQAGTLSGGEQQMLAIARALIAAPRILVLDEPSMGLAPKVIAEIVLALARLRDEGTTILLAEQNARPVLRVADRAALLARGHMVREGDAAEMRPLVEAGYFGSGR